jgi:hypothetical protein
VQASIGNLTDQPAVLNQAGGACNNCGTLELSANMFNSGLADADEGTYEVRFDALQNKPSVKEAPFLVRDGSMQRRVFAKLAYRTESSARKLYFNDQDTGCTWTTGMAQHFVITIDFNTRTTSVEIGGCGTFGPVEFQQQNAQALVNIGWVMTGIDAGIVGWDNAEIVRLADNVP